MGTEKAKPADMVLRKDRALCADPLCPAEKGGGGEGRSTEV